MIKILKDRHLEINCSIVEKPFSLELRDKVLNYLEFIKRLQNMSLVSVFVPMFFSILYFGDIWTDFLAILATFGICYFFAYVISVVLAFYVRPFHNFSRKKESLKIEIKESDVAKILRDCGEEHPAVKKYIDEIKKQGRSVMLYDVELMFNYVKIMISKKIE